MNKMISILLFTFLFSNIGISNHDLETIQQQQHISQRLGQYTDNNTVPFRNHPVEFELRVNLIVQLIKTTIIDFDFEDIQYHELAGFLKKIDDLGKEFKDCYLDNRKLIKLMQPIFNKMSIKEEPVLFEQLYRILEDVKNNKTHMTQILDDIDQIEVEVVSIKEINQI